jgi:hypothetical protein
MPRADPDSRMPKKPKATCRRCKIGFTPKVKGDTICQSCLPIVIEIKNRNCTDHHDASNSQVSFASDPPVEQQQCADGQDDGGQFPVIADPNLLKQKQNCLASKSRPEVGKRASARKNGVASIGTDEEGTEVRPKTIKIRGKVTANWFSSTLPTSNGVESNRINGRGETKEPSVCSVTSHAKTAIIKEPTAFFSASGGICDIIDRWDTGAYVQGDTLHAFSGVITTNTRKIATASAGVASWSAGTAKGIASINASVATASATASIGYDGASAFANASLVSVGAQLGPVNARAGLDLTSGASIGWGGIEVSVLGFGVSLGPKLGVSLPFFSFSVGL